MSVCEVLLLLMNIRGMNLIILSPRADIFDKHPFGIKMCERLCQEIIGCSISQSFLHCHVTHLIQKTGQSLFKVIKVQNNTCSRNSRFIYTNNKIYKCVEQSRIEKYKARKSHLLITPFLKKKPFQSYLLNIDDDILKIYPYLNTQHVAAMAFLNKQKKILVSRKYPLQMIQSYNLDKKTAATLVKGFAPKSIGVDEQRQLLFFGYAKGNRRSIVKMTTAGMDIKHIKKIAGRSQVTNIACDSKQEIVYIGLYTSIISISYDGKSETILTKGKFINVVTLNNVRNSIYFSRRFDLLELPLDSGEEFLVATFKPEPRQLVCYQDKLYVTCHASGSIFILDKDNNNTIQEVKTKYKRIMGLEICLIP